jgi:hypothetical protein
MESDWWLSRVIDLGKDTTEGEAGVFTCCMKGQNKVRTKEQMQSTYERALIFLLLRLRRRTRFFLHLALILNVCG